MNCWNERCGNAEFLDRLNTSFDEEQKKMVMKCLMELCGRPCEPTPFILDYLFVVVSEDPYVMPSVVDFDSEAEVLGCIRLLVHHGDGLFALLEIGKKASAKWAVTALKLVLSHPSMDYSKSVILKVSHSPLLSILLASARVFASDEFSEVRKMFVEKFKSNSFVDDNISEIPTAETHFWSALFPERINKRHVWENSHALLKLVPKATYSWNLKGRFLQFLNDSSHIYSHLIIDYIDNPSLANAYLVTNLFPRLLASRSDAGTYDSSMHMFPREMVQSLIGSLVRESQPQASVSEEMIRSPKIERQICEYTLAGIGEDKLVEIFTRMPSFYRLESILSTVLEYPALSTGVIGIITRGLAEWSLTIPICEQIFERAHDFTMLLVSQGSYVAFLLCLSNLMSVLLDDVHFEKVWFLFLTLFRYTSWRSGSKLYRSLCLDFLSQCDPLLRDMMNVILGREPYHFHGVSELVFPQYMRPFQKLQVFYNYLTSSNNLANCMSSIMACPYMWMSAVDWGIRTRSESATLLAQLPVPQYQLALVSMYHLMMITAKPMRACEAIYEYPDYDLIIAFPPRSISDVQRHLIPDITSVMKPRTGHPERVWTVAMKWRAWIQIFSLDVFVPNLISSLMWDIQSNTDPIYSRDLFITAALLLVATADEDASQIREILRIVVRLIEDGSSAILDGAELAKFCVILVISLRDQWKEAFSEILAVQRRIVTEETDTNCAKMIFAVNLIRLTFYISELQSLILPHMYDAIVLKHDSSFQASLVQLMTIIGSTF